MTVDEVDITFFPATSTASQILPAGSKHVIKQEANHRLLKEIPKEREEREHFQYRSDPKSMPINHN